MSMMRPETAFIPAAAAVGGMVAGTAIMTLDGALPVEFLCPGDRILTRAGVRKLIAVSVRVEPVLAMVRVGASTLGHDRPSGDSLVPADQLVLIRDWRAQALYGAPQVLLPATRLVDGDMITLETGAEVRLFTLQFDSDVVIYAAGLELACLRETVSV